MTNSQESNLKLAVDKKRREISSDNISMSIGELLNLYKDHELDIHPEFQRVFRWGPEQKSRLIESLFLGIPLPPIYVATNITGVWEVIDGVQRLSTIFEFMGELKGPTLENEAENEITLKPGLILAATKHLPELKDVSFSEIDQALRLEFKRTRLDVKVLSRDTSGRDTGKFDLFERLNTYGEPLSPQELRNCVLVNLNPTMFRWLKNLASNSSFRNCTLLSDQQIKEKYDMDLALRFIALRDASVTSIGDIHEFLRDRMEIIALDKDFNFASEEKLFTEIFEFLDAGPNSNSFRSWTASKEEFRGGFTLGGYEGVALAIGRHWGSIKKMGGNFNVDLFLKEVWSQPEYTKSFSGLRARDRMARVTPAVERVIEKYTSRQNKAPNKNNKQKQPK
ncbi:GmrSD restriction endonuclease domain-containing protein [Sphaerotilus sp.]|uniref:GmrSD restriction endonuclease domain-containing protein n=1 Tax=Sphaerotilus sp. TaxID=2093942 RepID=UPI0025F55490|nr:DUF262 domain-containing protein [Sphaerotilus sp.]